MSVKVRRVLALVLRCDIPGCGREASFYNGTRWKQAKLAGWSFELCFIRAKSFCPMHKAPVIESCRK